MRKAAKIDDNQPEIVKALRKAGCSVDPTSAMGNGFPDLHVGRAGVNYLLEVKDGSKSPSRRQLTDDQVIWHGKHKGQVAVVCNVDEALRAVGL